MSAGAELIAAERRRQIESEGYTADHDDDHMCGELLEAAECYLIYAQDPSPCFDINTVVNRWPWDEQSFKPTGDDVRNLVKAGALIAAEIDRLQALDV